MALILQIRNCRGLCDIEASGTSPWWREFAERWCRDQGWEWRWLRLRVFRADVIGEWRR